MDARPIRAEYDYPVAFSGWGQEERDAIDRVVASDKYTMSAECEALEAEFAYAHGMVHGIAVNSGSSANLIVIAALLETGKIKEGSTVAVPALAWATTFAPLVQHGLELLLCDCDETWNAKTIPQRPDLLLACPILGNPAYMMGAKQVAMEMRIPLIVDCCESIGAKDEQGELCGRHGFANTFSFYFSHQLSAVEGGMILTNDTDFAYACRLLRNHGWLRGLRPSLTLEDEFEFAAFGYNVRPLELHAAIAREQLKKLPTRIRTRLVNVAYWRNASEGLPLVHPDFHGRPSPFGIHFQVKSREIRQKLANALRADGIDCRPPIAGSFRLQPYGKRWADQSTPNADRIHETGLMIGNPPFDGSQLIDRAVAVMRRVL